MVNKQLLSTWSEPSGVLRILRSNFPAIPNTICDTAPSDKENFDANLVIGKALGSKQIKTNGAIESAVEK